MDQKSKNMIPKEKAQELVDKFSNHVDNWSLTKYTSEENAKQCALIAVDEILNCIVPKDEDERLAFELLGNQFYWQQVKTEIENYEHRKNKRSSRGIPRPTISG